MPNAQNPKPHVHLIGICGTAMASLAGMLQQRGHRVSGSDNAVYPPMSDFLARLGIAVAQPFAEENLDPRPDLVVVGNAISRGNVELERVLDERIPLTSMAALLHEEFLRGHETIGVAGTHGKTTTTSIVASLLDAGGLDPTVINGGIINAYGTNARLGAGDWMVVEADESDGTFLKLPADIAIVTNIDPEHLDHFHTFDAVQDAFRAFVENIPFYGFAVMCTDHPVVHTLVGKLEDRRILTYGENPQADIRLVDLDHHDGKSRFSVLFRDSEGKTTHAIDKLTMPMPGRHNALNATSAIAVAHELGVKDDVIRKAIGAFGGVKRRFTRVGEWNGALIIDDYGHHPVEIAAVLRAARESAKGQVIAVMQPHRYTRLHDLFDQFCTCFNDADAVIVGPVYPAGEEPIAGADRDALVAGLRAHGHRQIIALEGPEQLAGIIKGLAKPGDYVVCLGAGSITQWAYALPAELQAL